MDKAHAVSATNPSDTNVNPHFNLHVEPELGENVPYDREVYDAARYRQAQEDRITAWEATTNHLANQVRDKDVLIKHLEAELESATDEIVAGDVLIEIGEWLYAEQAWQAIQDGRWHYKGCIEDHELLRWLLAESEWKRQRLIRWAANVTCAETYNKGYAAGYNDGYNEAYQRGQR